MKYNFPIDFFKKLIPIFLILILPFSAVAIRLVLSGGGISEMLALTAFQEMTNKLNARIALTDTTLTRSEISTLFELIHNFGNSISSFEIEFTTTPQTIEKTVNRRVIYINPNKLYDENDKPKDYKTIRQVVFLSWIETLRSSNDSTLLSSSNWEQIADKLFDDSIVIKHVYSFNSSHSFWIWKQSSSNRNFDTSKLLFEDNGTVIDVTKNVTSSMICPDSAMPSLIDVQSLYTKGKSLIGNVFWSCGHFIYSGVLVSQMAQDLNSIDWTFSILNELEIETNKEASCGLVLGI
jgi:hypothetical protein